MSILKNAYYLAVAVLYILYFLNWFNLWHRAPEYLYEYNIYFQSGIAIIIMVLFKPFFPFKMDAFYRTIVFSCGLFLFTNVGLNTFLTNVTIIRNSIRNARIKI